MSPVDWDTIKSRHHLADVARRSGLDVGDHGRVMVCCPTPDHPDLIPSTRLDLDRDRYYCFGCGVHGDVIDWVRNIEGVDTATAVSILDSGRPINAVFATGTPSYSRPSRLAEPPQLDPTSPGRVAAANQAAWDYYSYKTLHERGVAYLASRGIEITALEAETAAPVVGHTPGSKSRIDSLVTHLAAKGFVETELLDAGLAIRLADGAVIDFLRDRVVFPAKDSTGAVTGLLGRDISGRAAIKYLNPPSTATYQKSHALYRPSQTELQPDASVVVCEGPLDALAVAASATALGVSARYAPIAACGTALTEAQIDQILAIHSRAPVLAGDGDQPGRRANIDWARRMLAKGRETVITGWPDGYDPASWLDARGPEGLMAVTRRGCLDDHNGRLRPLHCGAVLTEADFPDHDPYHRPDLAAFLNIVARATAPLPSTGRRRYQAAALSVFGPPGRPTPRAAPWTVTCPSHPEPAPSERIDL